jgi:hypothetical protein
MPCPLQQVFFKNQTFDLNLEVLEIEAFFYN